MDDDEDDDDPPVSYQKKKRGDKVNDDKLKKQMRRIMDIVIEYKDRYVPMILTNDNNLFATKELQ